MSNVTMLYTTPECTKPLFDHCPPEGRLLMASMSIPVFWYMLFDESSIQSGPSPDPEGLPYLHLSAPTSEALARAEARWPAVAAVIGSQLRVLFCIWCDFVRAHASLFLHCETYEWAGMWDTSEEFAEELRACLCAFNNIAAESGHLLAQAHVGNRHGALDPLGNLSYCGYSYGIEVPWTDDGDSVCGSMSSKVTQLPRYGAGPEDLMHYTEYVHSPIHAMRLAECRCGGRAFRVQKCQESASRTCVACGRLHYVMNSREYWDEGKAQSWRCQECDADVANVVVGVETDSNEQTIRFVMVAVRCVACGRMGCVVDWEAWDDLEALDDRCNAAWWLVSDGEDLVQAEQFAEALARYREAWEELPEPRAKQPPTSAIVEGLCLCAAPLRAWGKVAELLRPAFIAHGEALFRGVDADILGELPRRLGRDRRE